MRSPTRSGFRFVPCSIISVANHQTRDSTPPNTGPVWSPDSCICTRRQRSCARSLPWAVSTDATAHNRPCKVASSTPVQAQARRREGIDRAALAATIAARAVPTCLPSSSTILIRWAAPPNNSAASAMSALSAQACRLGSQIPNPSFADLSDRHHHTHHIWPQTASANDIDALTAANTSSPSGHVRDVLCKLQ
jgi:hypothetical protein